MSEAAAPIDDPLGAFCRDNHIALPATADGPLSGTCFAVKDVFDIAGTRTGFGNPDWLATHAPATRTASLVTRLLAAGARMMGKTITDELTYSLTGENPHYGTPLNSAAPERIPGGSSSGSAAAVAGAAVDFALGTDCGGSVRLPASYCGLLGLRPGHGALALDGVIPFAPSFDVAGWFARDARLFEQVGSVLFDRPAETTLPHHLLIADDAFELLAPPIAAALAPALNLVRQVCGTARHVRVSADGLSNWCEVFRTVQGAEIWAERRAWLAAERPHIGAAVQERLSWAETITADSTAAARAAHARIRTHVRGLIADDTVLCLPTSPRVAPLRGAPMDLLEHDYREQAMSLLCIAGLAGLPQITLPLAELDGAPLGLSLIGAPGRDMLLLATARALLAAARQG